jgi:hypothetical protein
MATYVLVGGAWLGGWCWKPIARHLRDQGHDAYPLTLTGLGERAHLAGPEVDLETHITDVVNLIEFEDLRASPSSSTWTADPSPTASPSSTPSRPKSGNIPREK